MNYKISVIIPCYNQPKLLQRNLQCLETQSCKNFNVVIIDDNSTEDYPAVISKFPNLPISYVRNEKNLGAIGNIFNSIFYATDAPYKISLHEDDALHPQYLEKALDILETDKDIAFVCTIAEWFKDDTELKRKTDTLKDITNYAVQDRVNFVREIITGAHIMLGSVVYRSSVLNEKPDLQKYDVLCDRPFLISLIKLGSTVAVLRDKAIFVRDHGEDDNRFQNVTEENCLDLMSFYKENLPHTLPPSDLKKMLRFSTNNLIYTYPDLRKKRLSFNNFIKVGKKRGLINIRYINKIGLVGLLKISFGEKRINKLIRLVKAAGKNH